ncbi:unnamed protein product [Calicophoron daubneyi]|uniref:BPL/LPL catalytic domain-containing protein n=1 Tax=Calicophoron daubneyi TaxID=300641 RepID=A0AAV2TT53_CALDB
MPVWWFSCRGPWYFCAVGAKAPRFPLRGCYANASSRSRVILLESGDIFRNLAFEACLYVDNARFASRQGGSSPHPTDVLLWRSNPCVVIGRFQNAWQEVNVGLLRQSLWPLARRQSGGGAVFHDPDNLNISFVQNGRSLDREKCMTFLRDVLQPLVGKRVVHVGKRYDLWMSGIDGDELKQFKISGSASKLSSKVSYHHCTLLCNTSLKCLSRVLVPTFKTLKTKATQSVRSEVVNLGLDVEVVQHAIIEQSLKWIQTDGRPSSIPRIVRIPEGEEALHVDEKKFGRELNQLRSWSWIYGSSPAFQLSLAEFEPHLIPSNLQLLVERNGRIQSVNCPSPNQIPENSLVTFLNALSVALQDIECRTHIHGVLDHFCAQWAFQTGELTSEQQTIVQAVHKAADMF